MNGLHHFGNSMKVYVIEGIRCYFVPLKTFCEKHGLPSDFGVATFEPKDYNGLARINTAGRELRTLRDALLSSIPLSIPLFDLPTVIDRLTERFRDELIAINPHVNLKDSELDFAVAGFGDVCQAYYYDRMRAHSQHLHPNTFDMVYHKWLTDSVRVSQRIHEYTHNDETWQVQIVNSAYGRIGMVIHTPTETHYVSDHTLACPAEGFMAGLLGDVAKRLDAAL